MSEYGLVIKQGQDMTRIALRCVHQHGLIYMVRGSKSWVCSPEHLHAHALAGFLGELVSLNDPKVKELMQRWGLYFRSLPLEGEEEAAPAKPIQGRPSLRDGNADKPSNAKGDGG
jgi:hypothetical protein